MSKIASGIESYHVLQAPGSTHRHRASYALGFFTGTGYSAVCDEVRKQTGIAGVTSATEKMLLLTGRIGALVELFPQAT